MEESEEMHEHHHTHEHSDKEKMHHHHHSGMRDIENIIANLPIRENATNRSGLAFLI